MWFYGENKILLAAKKQTFISFFQETNKESGRNSLTVLEAHHQFSSGLFLSGGSSSNIKVNAVVEFANLYLKFI